MKIVVIGVGNPLKCDDNIGNIVVEKLKNQIKKPNICFISAGATPENFIGKLMKIKPDLIYFIDAAEFEGKPGDIKLLDLREFSQGLVSTHGLPITIFKEFFPETKIRIVGIKTENIEYGYKISQEINEKFQFIVKKIEKLLLEK